MHDVAPMPAGSIELEIGRFDDREVAFDFPSDVRGNSKQRQAVLDAQREYFARHDHNCIVRGAILEDQGKEWLGSAALIALPTRKDVEALIAEEPFSRNGLYESILVQRHKFGGTPGQSK